jgi:DNA-directed RNA polymerase specialized sigma24 family protein
VCRFLDDMPQDEIASHLGVSRKTVGKRLDRIRDAVIALRGNEVAS